MENYIVRIYHRDPSDRNRVTGVLESVEQETRRPFQSIDALQSLLYSSAPRAAGEPALSSTPDQPPKPSLTLAK